MGKIIVVYEDGMFCNEPIMIPEVTDRFCAALTGCTKQVLENLQNSDKPISKEDMQKAECDLFDMLNHSFSRCLELTFPELCGRPDITEEAILELENKKLVEHSENVVSFPGGEDNVEEGEED